MNGVMSQTDVASSITAFNTLFQEYERVTLNATWNSTIQTNNGAIQAFDPTETALQSLTSQVQMAALSLGLPQVAALFNSNLSSAISQTISSTIESNQSTYIAALNDLLSSGSLSVSYGGRRMARLRQARCSPLPYMIVAGVLGIAAIFAPEVVLAVVAGVEITLGAATGAMAAAYGLAALGC